MREFSELLLYLIISSPYILFISLFLVQTNTQKAISNRTNVLQDNTYDRIQDEYFKTLVIPKIKVFTNIEYGDGLDVIDGKNAIWRDSISDHIPNLLVLAGHRVGLPKHNLSSMYYLTNIRDGDQLILYTNYRVYRYRVYMTKVLKPNDISVLNTIYENEIRIYTCTPIPTFENRYVVYGYLEK